MVTWLIILVIGLPWLGALGVAVAGDRQARLQHMIAVGFTVAAGLAALGLLASTTAEVGLRVPAGAAFGDFTFVPDGLGAFLAAVATVVGSLAVIFSVEYMHGEAQLGRYYALVLIFIGAMAGLVLTSSLLLLFFFWEIVALCSYALISFYSDDPKAVAGGIKSLIITQLGGLGLLSGVLIARSTTGSYDIATFLDAAGTRSLPALNVIAFGFLAAAAAKSAQVPFHTWLPDAMEAPTPVSALIHAATMVNAGVYLLARFYPAFSHVPGWTESVIAIGAVSALLAATMALVATDLKRVLAYSTISQLGYMFYAVGCGAIFASQFHLLSHAIFKALLFLVAGAVIHVVGTRDMRQMGGLGQRMPFVRNVFLVGAAALAGLPLFFNGFWSKDLVLEAGLEHGQWGWSLVLLLGVALTALYSFRAFWMVFQGSGARGQESDGGLSPSPLHPFTPPSAGGIALLVLALGTLSSALLAGPFAEMLQATLPFHTVLAESTPAVAVAVLGTPVTYAALLVVGLGLAAWWWRSQLTGVTIHLDGVTRSATADFGFEWLNRSVVAAIQRGTAMLRTTQSGQLNWNMIGIVGGLVIVLAILAWGQR